METHVVIMAGGIGSRFWPMSTPQMPKQFVDVMGVGKTMIQMTVDRLASLCPMKNFWVVTSERYVDIVRKQLPEIPLDHILAEPAARNTAPCIAYACWKIRKHHPEANVVVTPSDALVLNIEEYRRVIGSALEFTRAGERIVTVGICPTRPETGYGYIKGKENSKTTIPSYTEKTYLEVEEFVEKPDLETAKSYLASGNCWWNSGMFAFTADFFIKELQKCTPEIATAFNNIPNGNKPSISNINSIPYVESWTEMNEAYEKTPAIAIDIAVAEKTDEAYIVLASFDWDDVGSWDSFEKHSKGEGHSELIQSNNCFVYSDIPVAICGVDDITVVIKNGKALVMKKGASPLVRDAVKLMK